ncbi:glycosyltransferase, partial [Vibrio harveyi]
MISVCIATYNGLNYFEQQLTSILNQLSDSDEIVIVD